MPELKCTVQTCVHNRNSSCGLDKIQVGGNGAARAEETCCDSFQEKSSAASHMAAVEGSYTGYGAGVASACSCVACQAVQCKYNDQCQCTAGKISVEGSGACQSSQTECASFSC